MTTVAFDGKRMASDTLGVDAWGLKEEVRDKILRGPDFLAGTAGQHGSIKAWWRTVGGMPLNQVLERGYPEFDADRNDPQIMLVGADGVVWRHVTGGFFRCSRQFHAAGSGRDYALAAMRLGKTAEEAVRLAMEFDNGTGGDVVVFDIPSGQ